MPLTVDFDFRIVNEAAPEAFLDEQEIRLMFDSTRRSLSESIQRRFHDLVCGEHGEAPSFKISGVYDRCQEELDIQYHVDTCCRFFLLRVMRELNRQA